MGHYELEVQATGFSSYQRTGVVLDTDAALTLDASLQVGNVAQTVSVTDNTLHVETVSTQLGEVISGPADDGGAAERAQLHRSAFTAAGSRAPSTSIDLRLRCRTWARRFSIRRGR